MSYYDQAVMMHLRLGVWGDEPRRYPRRRGDVPNPDVRSDHFIWPKLREGPLGR